MRHVEALSVIPAKLVPACFKRGAGIQSALRSVWIPAVSGIPTSLVLLILLTCPPPSMAENLESDTSSGDYSAVDPIIYQKQDSIAEAAAFIGKTWGWSPDEKLAEEAHLKIAKRMIYAWKFHKPELLRSIISSKTEEMYKNKGNPEYLDSWSDQMAKEYLFPVHDTDPKFYVTHIGFDPNSKIYRGLFRWSELPETPVGSLYIRKRGGFGRVLQYVIEDNEIRISLETAKTHKSMLEEPEESKSDTSYMDYSILVPMIFQKQDSIAEARAFIGLKGRGSPEEKLADEKYLRVAKRIIYAWIFNKPQLLRSMFSSKTEEMYKNMGDSEYLDTWSKEMAEKYLFPVDGTEPKFYVTHSDFDTNSKRYTNSLKWSEPPETPVGNIYIHARDGYNRIFHYVIENGEIRISLEKVKPQTSKLGDKK